MVSLSSVLLECGNFNELGCDVLSVQGLANTRQKRVRRRHFLACWRGFEQLDDAATNHHGIGHAAHLGGALAGIAIVCIFWPEAPQSMIDQIIDKARGL